MFTEIRHNTENNKIEFECLALVLTNSSKELVKLKDGKENGMKVLNTVRILDGPFKGKEITATRTVVNSFGEEKDKVNKDDQVVIYARQPKPTTEYPTPIFFFDISTQRDTASQDDLMLAMDNFVAEKTVEEQEIG